MFLGVLFDMMGRWQFISVWCVVCMCQLFVYYGVVNQEILYIGFLVFVGKVYVCVCDYMELSELVEDREIFCR